MGKYLFNSIVVVGILLTSGVALANSGLLSVQPRSDYKNFSIFKSNSTCRGNLQPSLDRLKKLRNEGMQIAFVTKGGLSIATPRYQVKDVFQGKRYLTIKQMIAAMEDHLYDRGLRDRELIRDEVKNCVRGRHKSNHYFTQPCVKNFGRIYPHMGIAVLNSPAHPDPYIVHFHTNPETGWYRPSMRVETAESYFKESSNISCETKIILPKWSTQMKIKRALQSPLPERMLARGSKAYNLVSHPWGLKTQNCNEWLASFLAGALYTKSSQWNSVSREATYGVLQQTGFTPAKIVFNGGQSLAGLFELPGLSAYEGNIDHFYGVGDGLPSRTVLNWLKRHGHQHSQWLVRGRLD